MSYDALVVDGGWLRWRSAHSATRSGGDPAGERFLNFVLRAARIHSAQGLHVCWDGSRRGRTRIDPGYKSGGGSDTAPPEVRAEADAAQSALAAVLPLLGACQYVHPDWEADDGVASLCHSFAEEGRRVLLLTGDKDMMQCVRRGVHLLRPLPKKERPVVTYAGNWQEASVSIIKDGEGVPPLPTHRDAWLSFQAIRGDPGDKVPGVKGVGDKGAALAVREYPDVLQRMAAGDGLQRLPTRWRRLLTAPGSLEAAALSYELVRLRTDLGSVPFIPDAEDLDAAEEALLSLGWDSAASEDEAPLSILSVRG